ncbi:MAG TPA: DUF86 domain-containing protein [Vineibacter sp.]|nr:DUF86 domain-containing protein [Vineibacter sp.]
MKALRAPDYVSHILEAIERIETYTSTLSEAEFLASRLVQDAVIRNFEIIGEAAGNLQRVSPEIAAAHPEIPWHLPRGMRNFLVHVYWSVDASKVWNTVTTDLPHLKRQIRVLSRELSGGSPSDAPD